jgi:hypothetical protein
MSGREESRGLTLTGDGIDHPDRRRQTPTLTYSWWWMRSRIKGQVLIYTETRLLAWRSNGLRFRTIAAHPKGLVVVVSGPHPRTNLKNVTKSKSCFKTIWHFKKIVLYPGRLAARGWLPNSMAARTCLNKIESRGCCRGLFAKVALQKKKKTATRSNGG